MKKSLALLLAILTLLSTGMTACSNVSEEQENDDVQAEIVSPEQIESDAAEETEYKPPLPEVKFEDRTFTILQGTHLKNEHYSEQLTGDVLVDAIYERNLKIEDIYGVKFQYLDDEWNRLGDLVRTSVIAQDGLYNMVGGHAVHHAGFITQMMYEDFKEMPYVSEGLNYRWWNRNVVEDLSIANKIYMIAGDIGYMNIGHVEAVLFNKNLFDDNGMAYPYDLVLENKWTYDAYMGLVKDKNRDLNGDGDIVGGEDLFGFSSMQLLADTLFFYAFGGVPVTKDENDLPVLDLMNDKHQKIIETGYEWLIEQEAYMPPCTNDHTTYINEPSHVAFKQDLAFTFVTMLKHLNSFRDMESDYGVVPFPLLDENQEEYISPIDGGVPMVIVPILNDTEYVGLIIEALARESSDTVVPAFYEATLLGKYSRDEISQRMFEIIRNTTRYDLGYILSFGTGSVGRTVLSQGGNYSSWCASNEKLLNKKIKMFIRELED